jgi:hypothetical protein
MGVNCSYRHLSFKKQVLEVRGSNGKCIYSQLKHLSYITVMIQSFTAIVTYYSSDTGS